MQKILTNHKFKGEIILTNHKFKGEITNHKFKGEIILTNNKFKGEIIITLILQDQTCVMGKL
jgi:hypothetical protein